MSLPCSQAQSVTSGKTGSQSHNQARMSKEGRMGTKQISPATEIGSCFFPNLRNAIKQISHILDVLEASIGNVQDWIEVCFFYWLPSSQQYLRFSINSERVVITEWKRHFAAHCHVRPGVKSLTRHISKHLSTCNVTWFLNYQVNYYHY